MRKTTIAVAAAALTLLLAACGEEPGTRAVTGGLLGRGRGCGGRRRPRAATPGPAR